MSGIYTSRGLETACRRDINFMWLLQSEKGPDHNTIARFRSERLTNVVEDLFRQLVEKLHECGEIAFENLFVDGTKIEACANKYSFVWKKAVTKNEVRLQSKAKNAIGRITRCDKIPEEGYRRKSASGANTVARPNSSCRRSTGGMAKVSTNSNCSATWKKSADTLSGQEQYNRYNALFDGAKQLFKNRHRRDIYAYERRPYAQLPAQAGGTMSKSASRVMYVVGIDINSERNDQMTLIPFLDKLQTNYPHRFRNIVADAGYESEENYVYLSSQNYTSYIKPKNYEQGKSRKYQNDPYRFENMAYDEESDTYTCSQGRSLLPVFNKHSKSKSGYVATVQVYECTSCEGCPVKSRCTKAAGNRQLQIAKTFLSHRQASLDNITTPLGILLRMNRSIQVEGAFGVLKEDYGFRRFLLRGQKNVRTEYLLLCMGYNLNKLHNKIQNERCRSLLHKVA